MTQLNSRRNVAPFALGLLLILLVMLAAVALMLQPSSNETPTFGFLLGLPLALAVLGAWITTRSAWWRRFRSVSLALFAAYAVGALLIWLTVRITSQLMFISEHDAALAELIVAYATAIALVFGYFVTSTLRDGIANLTQAAKQVQLGNLAVRADERGGDELAQLARAFNGMTRQLQTAQEEQVRSDQARRAWVAWVSHDLRTPLTSLRARAEALSDGVITSPDEVQDYLHAMKRDVQSLSGLVNDLSELATIEAGGLKLERTDVSLSDIVSDTIESLRVVAEQRGLSLSGSVAVDVDPIHVNPQHIQRVLNNLMGNSIRHTSTGGVSVEARREGAEVCVYVRDTGEGIPAADLRHVFDQFYRGDAARTRSGQHSPHMGLGLTIAKALIEAHGGRIGINSEFGNGTEVWFALPA